MKLPILMCLIVSLMLVGACATPSDTMLAPEPAIPAHYTTYTDHAIGYSISYPPDWDDVEFQEYMIKVLEASGSNPSPESIETIEAISSTTLFTAGVPTGKGYYVPLFTVVRIPSPMKELKLDNLVEAIIEDAKRSLEEFTVLLRTTTIVDGREVAIIELKTETYYPGMEIANQLQMIMLKNNYIWIVTCTSKLEEYTRYKNDFYHIVKSLRILK